ncbi:hypothetical protein [Agromyces aerolatus]|uniref:hypothetical protein n=1 Tax=Agromyces sp. LY-1074 TaxID=3074080 RepID=UPI0028628AD4|nr:MULTISPECIES: hypothetical protein [unclassified Agromyces]MDR5700318.1 hypothetical protein [Agromyces sp. LY-1074]MDR5706704.1 hypothetical protein [Agromyces sp. LY-1358]
MAATAGSLLVLGLPMQATAEEVPLDPAAAAQAQATEAGPAPDTPTEPEAGVVTAADEPGAAAEPPAEPAPETPQTETPPAEVPAETPPAEVPPAEAPPAEAPPAEAPPAGEADPAEPADVPAGTAPSGDAARSGGSHDDDEAEASHDGLTVSKEVTDLVPLGDAGWRVEYAVTVENDGRYATKYSLTDSLDRFGDGIRFEAAEWTGPNNTDGEWTDLPDDLEAQLADRVQIPARSTHEYTVRVFATVTQASFDDGTYKCQKHEKWSGGFRNSVVLEFAGGWRTASDCVTPDVAELTLVKHVDNTPIEGLAVDPAEAADWLLLAETIGLNPQRVEATGNEDGVSIIVSAGLWNLSEIRSPVSTNPLVPDWYEASDWTCGYTPVTDGAVRLKSGRSVTCEITNTAKPNVELEVVKTHQLPPGSGDAVEAGDEFSWQVTITNVGMPVTGLSLGDLIDDQLEQTGPATFEPAAGWTQVSEVTDPEFYATFDGAFDTGDVVTVFIPVRMLESDPVQTPPAVGSDDPAPVLPPLDESPLPNEACVGVPGWVSAPWCDDDEIPVKRIDAGAYVRCVNDVPWLYFDIQATPSVPAGPVTVTWTSGDGTLTTEPIQLDALTGRLLWPGAAVDENGIPYQWPGWRPLTEQDLTNPPVPGERFLDLILDETVPTYPWRDMENPASITFSVNPSQTVLALYPMAMPSCEIERPAELVIDKTSSVTNAAPGTNFSYMLQVSSVGTGAAEPVELVDEIPSDLRVDSIATAPEPAFPRWENCTVTGQNSAGYGGTLRCDLLGVLGPNLPTAPPVTLSVHLNEGATATSVVNTGEVCWGESTGDDVPDVTQCAEDSVTVTIPQKPVTPVTPASAGGRGLAKSGFDGAPLLWAGGALLLVGGLASALAIRRRRGGASE